MLRPMLKSDPGVDHGNVYFGQMRWVGSLVCNSWSDFEPKCE